MLNYLACLSAFEAGLLHRDPSIGNIMIGRDSKGRLNDWDLCRGVDVDESLEGPRTVRGFPMCSCQCLHLSTGDLAIHVNQAARKSGGKTHNH